MFVIRDSRTHTRGLTQARLHHHSCSQTDINSKDLCPGHCGGTGQPHTYLPVAAAAASSKTPVCPDTSWKKGRIQLWLGTGRPGCPGRALSALQAEKGSYKETRPWTPAAQCVQSHGLNHAKVSVLALTRVYIKG